MTFIAHIKETGEIQTCEEHCKNVAIISKDFSVAALKDVNYCAGLLHDIGKYQESFQKRIRGESLRVEHAICGAKECKKLANQETALTLLLELCIAGHHGGIPDCGNKGDTPDKSTLQGRLARETEAYSAAYEELEVKLPLFDSFAAFLKKDCDNNKDLIEKFAFVVRYCFSCLVDADSLDTAAFMGIRSNRHMISDFQACLNKINDRLNSFKSETVLQKTRSKMQQQAYAKIHANADIFLMNMPTGSGKTLCSMKFALERAIVKNKQRIIYVIPYNSIIDQTYDEFEKLFGESANILRHQSSYTYSEAEDMEEGKRLTAMLACENWDADIIITTAVQFFETLYANKRSKLRKLHNISDSIILFDEAHMMPENYFAACIHSIALVTSCLNSEVVFMTATMPDFQRFFQEFGNKSSRFVDLISDKQYFDVFRKCSYRYLGQVKPETLMEYTQSHASCLIITNTKKRARELYAAATGEKYHLSTWMTAKDRSKTIATIKQKLKKLEEDFPDLQFVPPERRIIVVSTSLIEAGVDMDFSYVLRELAGLDNILQAGGRCNREGKRKDAEVNIFSMQDDHTSVRQMITKGILKEYADIASEEAISQYYNRLFYTRKEEIIKNTISECYSRLDLIGFAEYWENVKLIDTQSISVAVATDEESRQLISALQQGNIQPRKLQKHSFSVSLWEFEELLKAGVLDDFETGLYCLTNADYYTNETGVQFEAQDYYE